MIDLTAAIERIAILGRDAGRATQPQTLEINGRNYLADGRGGYNEVSRLVLDDTPRLDGVNCADIASLIAWCAATGTDDGEILLSRSGTSYARSPRRVPPHHKRDEARKPFFDAYLPPWREWGRYSDLRGWIDTLADGLEAADDVQAAVQSISIEDGSTVKLRQSRAAIIVETSGKAEVRSSLPRILRARIPFGDPSFETAVEFLVTARVDKGKEEGMAFRADLRAPEAAYQAWVDWAQAEIAESGLGWPVFVTP